MGGEIIFMFFLPFHEMEILFKFSTIFNSFIHKNTHLNLLSYVVRVFPCKVHKSFPYGKISTPPHTTKKLFFFCGIERTIKGDVNDIFGKTNIDRWMRKMWVVRKGYEEMPVIFIYNIFFNKNKTNNKNRILSLL